jgi:hypothetical protein
MVNFKKLVAILCSATMVIGASVTAFAADPPAPSSQPGTGNIVAYSIDTVTVPTTLKVSFNPQGWTIYKDANDTTGTTAQIVSLNYAVSSMATMNRKFTVSFEASGTPGSTGDPVVFVDSADKAAPKTDDNPDGAEFGELKLYLATAGGQALVTESRDGTAFAVTDGVANITTDLLADVTLTPATGGNQVFVAGEDKAESEIAFKLGKAEYQLKADAHPSFDTTQEAFKTMVEPKKLGEIVGFTFTGAMNTNADWTKANLSAIAITPTYEFDDADGTEEDITGGGKNQIKPVGAVTVLTGSYDSTNTRYQIALPEGVVISNVSEVTNIAVNGATITDIATNGNGAVVRVNRSTVSAALGTDWPTTNELVFTFTIGSTNYKSTMSKN